MEEEAKRILAKMTDEEKEQLALIGIMFQLSLIKEAIKAIKEIKGNG